MGGWAGWAAAQPSGWLVGGRVDGRVDRQVAGWSGVGGQAVCGVKKKVITDE